MIHTLSKIKLFFQQAEDVAEETVINPIRDFLRLETAGGILLALAAIAALIVANTPLHDLYNYIFNEVDFRIGFSDLQTSFDMELKKPILLWINDGLMAIFFFLVGLEIKRDFVQGDLSKPDRFMLPAMAAIGGIVLPACIFWFFNHTTPENISGWAIPAATDIAFALGVLSLLGKRVPTSLKVLLTAIAVLDDIAAILIIAIFYSHDLHIVPLYYALAALVVLLMLNKNKVTNIAPYAITGLILWVAVLESGVHATVAGVIAALFIPTKGKTDDAPSPLVELEHNLHPWIAFGVLPLFAFANAGISFKGIGFEALYHPVTLGIILGLFLGKQLGIFAMFAIAHITKIAPKPGDVNWPQMYGLATLCGIGFTMSLFIGGLAYNHFDLQVYLRTGVLVGSLLSAILGVVILILSTPQKHSQQETQKK